jgi:hypothetical protein
MANVRFSGFYRVQRPSLMRSPAVTGVVQRPSIHSRPARFGVLGRCYGGMEHEQGTEYAHAFTERCMSMRLAKCLAVLLAFVAVTDNAAQELRQERLFAIVPVGPNASVSLRKIVEIDTRASNLGAVLREWPLTVDPPESWGLANWGKPEAVVGGRYLVWISGARLFVPAIHLNVFDTVSGVARSFERVVNGSILALDNVLDRIFFWEPGQIAVLDARIGSISRFPYSMGTTWDAVPPPATYAADIDRLFVRRPFDWQLVDAIDVASGKIVQTISIESTPTESNSVMALATDRAGTRLYMVHAGFAGIAAVSLYDAMTSRFVARTSLSPRDTQEDYRLQFDSERRRLLVGSLVVFDADTLNRLGSSQGVCTGDPQCRYASGPSFALVGARSPVLFLTSKAAVDYVARTAGCVTAPLEARDPISGQLLGVADLSLLATLTSFQYGGCVIAMGMATVPAAPRALTSDIQGRRVTLSWIDPGNTTHFQVEAGSATGVANLFDRAVGATSFTISDVPPGTYYVRVRAINYVGRSLPVEVPVIVR